MVSFDDALRAEVPGLAIEDERDYSGHWRSALDALSNPDTPPSTRVILDLIEFCWKRISKPVETRDHSYHKHRDILEFDRPAGREQFRCDIETIFRRNGISYKLTEEGRIERSVPLAFQSTLVESGFDAGDTDFNRLLSTAQRKFLDPRPDIRREALEALWDAWERLKTLNGQGDKKAQAKAMLDGAAGTCSPIFRAALEREAKELTSLGNSLGIRHSETNQEILASSEHVDYLFYRLFSLVHLILRST